MDTSKFDCTKEQTALGLDILKCVKMDADSMFGMQFQCPSDAPKCADWAKCMQKALCDAVKKGTKNPAACAKHVDKSFASDCKLSCTVFRSSPSSSPWWWLSF